MIEFELKGIVPAKKNARNIFVRAGKIVNRPNQKYEDWLEYALIETTNITQEYETPIDVQPLYIGYIFRMPDYKRRDLSNMIQSIEDMLAHKDRKIISDDAWAYLQTAGIYAILDPENVGVTVYIEDDRKSVQKVLDTALEQVLP